jgi:hypothetical protein
METNGPPSVVNRSNKEFVVRHREYIQDIYSLAGTANTPSSFGLRSYSINPGDSTTFPWLSTIADKFEQYRIEGMVFEYKSLYSDAVVTQNGSIGSIVLATEYNSGSPSFSTKQAMENYQFAQSCKPSLSVLHPIECARSQNVLSELYVRQGPVPAGEDVKTYDFGDFQIASQGIPLGAAGAAVNMGELWVSYQIALIKPRISSHVIADPSYAHFASQSGVAAFSTANPAPKSVIYKSRISTMPVVQTSDNLFTFTLGSTPQSVAICASWITDPNVGTGANVWRSPGFTFSNMSLFSDPLYSRGAPWAASYTGTGCVSQYYCTLPAATPSASTASFTISNSGSFDTTNSVRFQMVITSIPTNANDFGPLPN